MPGAITHEERFTRPQVYAVPRAGEDYEDAELQFCVMMLDQELQHHVARGAAERCEPCH